MAQTKTFRLGPTALSTTLTTNLCNPGTLTGGVGSYSGGSLYIILRHIRIVNKHASTAATFSLWLGATGANAAGTELWTGKSIAANDSFEWYGNLKMTSTDFLVGGSGTATALTITVMSEQIVV